MSEDDDLLADILEGSDVEGESVTSPTHRTPGKVRAHAVSVPESPYGTPQLAAAQAPTLNGSFHTTAGTLYSPVSDNEEETRGRRSGSPEQTSAPAANPLEALGKFVAPPPARVPAPPVAARGPASAVPGVFVPPYMYPGMYGAPVSVPAASAPKPSSTSEFDKKRERALKEAEEAEAKMKSGTLSKEEFEACKLKVLRAKMFASMAKPSQKRSRSRSRSSSRSRSASPSPPPAKPARESAKVDVSRTNKSRSRSRSNGRRKPSKERSRSKSPAHKVQNVPDEAGARVTRVVKADGAVAYQTASHRKRMEQQHDTNQRSEKDTKREHRDRRRSRSRSKSRENRRRSTERRPDSDRGRHTRDRSRDRDPSRHHSDRLR